MTITNIKQYLIMNPFKLDLFIYTSQQALETSFIVSYLFRRIIEAIIQGYYGKVMT
jgi:hypothetical protein